jgi:hypothetical protein
MQEQLKLEIPGIDLQTGVSKDYSNEISSLRVNFLEGRKDIIIQEIKKHRIRKYEEVYPLSRFNNVITEKNKNAINRLNQLADQMNTLLQDKGEAFDENEFASLCNEMWSLIYGPKATTISAKDFGKLSENK